MTNKNLTGYPSIDKPWLHFYPKTLFNGRKHYDKIMDKLKDVWHEEEVIIEYYGTEITTNDFFYRIDNIARSLCALGIKKNDSIAISLDATPEFIELLLASEIIGCSLKNYFGVIDDIIQFLNKNKSTYYITQDFINTADINRIYAETCVNHIITINPLYSVVEKSKIRENNLTEINSRYKSKPANDERNIDFTTFLNIGSEISPKPIHGEYPLFSAFTSGTTGDPKEVIHSSKSIIGIVEQLSLFPNKSKQRDTWLLTLLPPTLVAVVVAMIIYPLADGKRLILDPYCRLEDIDLEMMHYEPNCWPTIPIFFSILLNSKRIPENYDMSYFKLFGFGAESLHYKFINEVQDFLERHNCKSQLGVGYGQSEGGSDFTVTAGVDMIKIGRSGFPLIDTTISIFKPGTTEELKYNEVGEIAKSGPGIMLGYQSEELTKTVLKVHSDGTTWLHTGDTGFMNENGLLFVLGREGIHIFPNKRICSWYRK